MKKDRDLSPLEFYDILQREYFENLLRSKIYPKRKDKTYYKKVMKFKKEKILDISAKNGLPNVFHDQDIEATFRGLIFPSQGLPPINLTEDDIANYYSVGSDVRINTGVDIELGRITGISPNFEIISVKLKNDSKIKDFTFKHITRIL